MRISDWSSDVCSSDLVVAIGEALLGHRHRAAGAFGDVLPRHLGVDAARDRALGAMHREEAAYLGQDPVERPRLRSEEHTSELQSLMRISYAVFCLKKKKKYKTNCLKKNHTTTNNKKYKVKLLKHSIT